MTNEQRYDERGWQDPNLDLTDWELDPTLFELPDPMTLTLKDLREWAESAGLDERATLRDLMDACVREQMAGHPTTDPMAEAILTVLDPPDLTLNQM